MSSYLSNSTSSKVRRSGRKVRRSASPADARRRPLRSATDNSIIAPERLLALFAAKGLDALIDSAFPLLRAAVACDFATAFYRSGGRGLLKARDSRGREYGRELMRRHLELNPAIPLASANPGIKLLSTRTGLPHSNKELRKTAFYREIMQPLDWRHSVALCFWGDPPAKMPVFVLSADRSEDQSDFSDHEVAALIGLHPFLDCAVNRLLEREAAETVRDGMAIAVDDGTRGVVILDRNFLLVQANLIARQLSAAWMDDARTPVEGSSGAG